ncbi:MAG TPA: LysR family transcriptional regulator [Stellaceae bacterium]|nr:LysR family transcriptional regulator [Stellaceae bacterium]
MDAGDLRVFEAVARLGAMNRAAEELHTVQSNVTARIRQIETELGTALFERHSRGVVPTAAGRRLLPYAERVRLLLAEARRVVKDDGEPAGTLAIGSLETTAGLRLPPLLAQYAAAYPAVDLSLVTGTTAALVKEVLDHRLDGAFVCGPVEHDELVEERAFREELVALTSPRIASLDALFGERDLKIIVFRIGCSYRQRLEAILAGRGLIVTRSLEFGTIEGILGCVGAGIGVSLLPRAVVAEAARDGRIALHALPPAEAQVDTVFVRRRDGFASSALKAFLALARPLRVRSEAAE